MANEKSSGYTIIRTLLRKNLVKLQPGYTLIEILVALSIAGILFTSGFASFRDFSRRQLLAGSLRSLKGDLRLAQGYAFIGKKPPGGNCDDPSLLDGYRFFVFSSTRYIIRAYCSPPGGQIDVKVVDLPSDVTIANAPPNPINPITFKSLGEGTNLSVDTIIRLTQTSTGKTADVIVTQGGEIK